jgi:hypothetical protein
MTTSSKKEKQMVSSDLRGDQTWSTQDIVAKLQQWRDEDQADAIALTRGEIITLLEVIHSLQQDVNVVHADICSENDNLKAENERLRAELSGRARDDGTYVHRLDEREGDE